MSTTALFCHFAAHNRIGLDAKLGDFIPESAASTVTFADLLCHRAGLPPYLPFFAEMVNTHPELVAETRGEDDAALRERVSDEMRARFLKVAPVESPGTRAVYSDIGFVLIGEALERLGGAPLDVLFFATRRLAPSGCMAPPSVECPTTFPPMT